MTTGKVNKNPDNWEDVCNQCGLCCLVKIIMDDGNVFLTKILCDNLDKKSGKCNCYSSDFDHRLNENDSCSRHDGSRLNMDTLRDDYVVPGCCPYVKKFVGKNNLRPPKIDFDECIYEKDVPAKAVMENYIIGHTWTLFKYNPQVNKRLKEEMKSRRKKSK